MNELIQTFNFNNNEVRTAIKDNGDVYFCLADVADVIEISNANPSRFSLDEKGVHKMYTPAHNLKTEKCGIYVLDKARSHSKQVENFRYYDNIIPILKSFLESEVQA